LKKRIFAILFAILSLSGLAQAQTGENPFDRGSELWEGETSGEKPPSKWTAAGLSLLVPGAGQAYMGKRSTAAYFFAAEGAIWSAFAGYTIYGNWREENFKNFAARHAGASPEGKDETFFENMLDFDSRDEYNYWMHLIYRDEVPLYPTTREFFWQWESDEAMDEYADIRYSSERAFRTARTMLGVALVNRVVSVVDVFRTDIYSLRGESAEAENRFLPQAYLGPSSDGMPSFGLRLVRRF